MPWIKLTLIFYPLNFVMVLRWFVFVAVVVLSWLRATNISDLLLIAWEAHYIVILVPTCLVALFRVPVFPYDWKLERDVLFLSFLNFVFSHLLQLETSEFIATRMISFMLLINVFFNFALNQDWHVWHKR